MDAAWERVVHYGHDEPKPKMAEELCRTARIAGPLPKEDLVSRSGGFDTENEELAEWLVEHNYLLKDSDGWLRYQYAPHVLNTATAYELKLQNWEKGISQARKYRAAIAWRAYVVVDADRVSAAVKNLDQFKEENVGLMALSRDSLEVIHEPDRMRNHTPNRPKKVQSLSESTFRHFLEEHPPRDHERTPAYDIGEHQNPYQAAKTGRRVNEILGFDDK